MGCVGRAWLLRLGRLLGLARLLVLDSLHVLHLVELAQGRGLSLHLIGLVVVRLLGYSCCMLLHLVHLRLWLLDEVDGLVLGVHLGLGLVSVDLRLLLHLISVLRHRLIL